MEFELESVGLSADEQHHSGESDMISQSSDRQNASGDNKILKESNIISQAPDRQNASGDNEILKESNMVLKLQYSFFLTINNINLIYIYH